MLESTANTPPISTFSLISTQIEAPSPENLTEVSPENVLSSSITTGSKAYIRVSGQSVVANESVNLKSDATNPLPADVATLPASEICPSDPVCLKAPETAPKMKALFNAQDTSSKACRTG